MHSIESLKDRYDPEHDIDVDFAWIDFQLLGLIEAQQNRINELEQTIAELRKSFGEIAFEGIKRVQPEGQ